jgi:hypothetical membrane protein
MYCILLCLIIYLSGFIFNPHIMNTKQLLNFGTATALTFWLSTFIAGYIHGNYNHISDTISELGALGTKSHTFMTIATWLGAVFGTLFFIGIIRACRQVGVSVIPVLTTIGVPFSFAWVAIFPSGTERHPQGGIAMFLLYIGLILAIIIWRGERMRTIRTWSFISLILMLLLFFRFTSFIGGHEGLLQRFAHLGWAIWFISLNICFAKLIDDQTKKITN